MRHSRLVLASFLSIVLLGPGMAQNIYVSQNGSGTTNSLAWLNNAANWGSAKNQIGPGTTIHLVGTITNTIVFQASGTPGSPITLHFESNAMCSGPTLGFPYTMWIAVNGGHDIVIDGGVNGILQCTDNGTGTAYGGTCDFQNGNMFGVDATAVANFTVQNLTISNLYNRLPSSADIQHGSCNSTAINISGNNITIQNNNIYNTSEGIFYSYGGNTVSSNLYVIGNTLVGWNHGITLACSGANANPIFYNGMIRSNRLDGMDFYEDQTGSIGYYHRDGIFIFSEANYPANYSPTNDPATYYSGYASNIDVSCNFIGPGVNPKTTDAGTGAIFVDNYSTNQYSRLLIYNNILTLKPPLQWSDNFILGGIASGSLLANNTLVGWTTNISGGGTYYGGSSGVCGGGQNYGMYNNLQYNCTGFALACAQPTLNTVSVLVSNLSYFSGFKSDYNILPVGSGQNAFELGVVINWGTAQQYEITALKNTLSQWQALGPQFDPHGITKIPSLNTNTWSPLAADTVARGGGTNLSAYFTNDFYGNPRPATGPWDIGAVTYSGTTLAPPATVVGYSSANLAVAPSFPYVLASPSNLRVLTPAELAQLALQSTLLAWYTFDEGSGATAGDSSGNGHTITFAGNGWGPGEITNAIEGFNTAMSSSIANPPTLGTTWTISVWLHPDSTSTGSYEVIWANASAGIFYRHDIKHIDFYNGGDHLNTTVYTENQWLFVTIVNNAGALTFYLNGVPDGTAAAGTGFQPASVLGNGSGQNFKGYMDDLRIYNIALTAAQVAAQYQWPN